MDPENLPKFVYLHNNHKYRLKLGFYAAPSNPKTFSKAIRSELDKLKFTYCADLNGLVMGFGKISSNELIPADIRHSISVAVNVDVYIFRPPVGSVIEAVVNQTSESHVSCLVHNLFNVSIVRPEHEPYDQWPGSKINKDDKIDVKVLSFDLTKKLPHITGDIVDIKKSKIHYLKDEQANDFENCSSSAGEEPVSNCIKPIKHLEKDDSYRFLKHSVSDSDSSDDIDSIQNNKVHCSKKPSETTNTVLSPQLVHTTNNIKSKYLKDPIASSTPVSGNEHSVSNINIIRNKQLKQLHKHLAKNNVVEKQKSSNLKKDKLFLSSKTFKEIKNNDNDNKFNLPITSIDNTDYSDGTNKIKTQDGLQSDSGISDGEHKQKRFSLTNTSDIIIKKKYKSSDKNMNSILNYFSPNTKKSDSSQTNYNLFVDPKTNHSCNEDEEHSVYTQSVHNYISSDNSKKDILNKSKSPIKSTLNKTPMLKSNIESIKEINSSQKMKYCENTNENKTDKKHPKSMFSPISNLEIRKSDKNKKNVSLTNQKIENNGTYSLTKLNKDIKNDISSSSSDDEMYIKLKQNISNIENTKSFIVKDKKSYDPNSSEDNSNSSSPIFPSLKLDKSYTKSANSINMLVTNKHNINNDNNLLPNKVSKNQRKSILLQPPTYNDDNNKYVQNMGHNENNKDEKLNKSLKYSSSDNGEIINQNIFNKTQTSNTSKLKKKTKSILKKKISNPFLKLHSTSSTSTSSEDENCVNQFLIKNSTSIVAEDNTEDTLMQHVLTSVEHDKKLKQELTHQCNYSSFSNNSALNKNKQLKEDEPLKKTKNKKHVNNSIEKPKIDTSVVNTSKIDTVSQLQMESFSDNNTDDEIDMIKKIILQNIKQQKLNKKKKINCPNLAIKCNNIENLNKLTKASNKLIKKSKSQNSPMIKTNKLINNGLKTKIKKLKEPRDLILSSSLEESSNTVKNNKSIQVNKSNTTSKKEEEKSKIKSSIIDTDLAISNVIKTKTCKKSKNLLLDNIINNIEDTSNTIKNNDSIQLNKTIKKNLKSQSESLFESDKLISNTLKTKKKPKNLFIDGLMNTIKHSRTTENNSTKLNKTLNKKNKILKSQSSLIETDQPVSNDIETNTLKESKNLFLDSIINNVEDSCTMKYNDSLKLSKMFNKKERKQKSQSESLFESDELTNDNLKTKKKFKESENLPIEGLINTIDHSRTIENNNSTKLNKTLNKKDKKSKNQSLLIETDQPVSNDIETNTLKGSKNLFLDSIINNVEDSCTMKYNDSLKLNKMFNKKERKQKSQSESLFESDELINDNLKTKKKFKKSENVAIEGLINTIDQSRTTENNNSTKLNKTSNKKSKTQSLLIETDQPVSNYIETNTLKGSKNLFLDSIINNVEDSSCTMKYNDSLKLNKMFNKKERKQKSQSESSLFESDELINDNLKTKKKFKKSENLPIEGLINTIDQSRTTENNNSTKLNKTSNKKDKKSKTQFSLIETDQSVSNDIETIAHKESKNLLLDSIINNVEDSSCTMKYNDSLKLNKMLNKKERKQKSLSKLMVKPNKLINTSKKKKKLKQLLIDDLINTIKHSNTIENNNSIKLNKTPKTKDKKSKSQISSIIETDQLINNDKTTKKKTKVSKKLLLNSIINSLVESSTSEKTNKRPRESENIINSILGLSNDDLPVKKKKKYNLLTMDKTSDMFENKNLDKSLCKIKKKKSTKHTN